MSSDTDAPVSENFQPKSPKTAWPIIGRWFFILAALAGYAILHLHLAGLLIAQTNFTDKDILGGDQKNNLKLALQTREDLHPDFATGVSVPIKNWFPHRTDGVVNPLWPWIAAWLADGDHTISANDTVTPEDRALFNRGRWFNVGLTLGFLVVLGIACARVFSVAASLNIVLLAGLGAFLPRAVFFQPEPLYFTFFLLTWVACVFALQRNSLWVYALIGILSGVAYMAKGSVQPLIAVFIAVSTLRWLWGWIIAHWPRGIPNLVWVRRNHFFGLFLLVGCHLMTIGPRLIYANERFGDGFHSYPGYWMWFDDFESCYAWMGNHNTRAQLEALTPATKPSFANYKATHTGAQMWDRLRDGMMVKTADLVWPGVTKQSTKNPKPWKGLLEWRGVYLAILTALGLLLAIAMRIAVPRPERAWHRLHPESATICLFVFGSLAAYTLAYGWYTPIGRGDRFMLSLYAPLVLSAIWGAESLLHRARRRQAPSWLFKAYHIAQWLLLALILSRVVEILSHPVFKN